MGTEPLLSSLHLLSPSGVSKVPFFFFSTILKVMMT